MRPGLPNGWKTQKIQEVKILIDKMVRNEILKKKLKKIQNKTNSIKKIRTKFDIKTK
jgi:hypothetical protein